MKRALRRMMLWVLNPRPRWWQSSQAICVAGFALVVIAAELRSHRDFTTGTVGAMTSALVAVGMVAFVGSAVVWYLRASQHAWYREQIKRARVAVCPQCGYDMRGLLNDRCPECGTNLDWAVQEARENLSHGERV